MSGSPDETVLRMTASTKVVVWLFCAGVGVALGFLLPWLLQYIASWPIPYIDVLKFLGSFDAPVMVVGRPAVLAVVGLVIAFLITWDSAQLTIDDGRILVRKGDDTRIIERAAVAGVHRHGGKVRIESKEGRVLFDDDVEGGRKAIAEAFLRHGYPWEGAEAVAAQPRTPSPSSLERTPEAGE